MVKYMLHVKPPRVEWWRNVCVCVCVEPIGTPHSDVIKRVTVSMAVGLALCSGERGWQYMGQGDESTMEVHRRRGVGKYLRGVWEGVTDRGLEYQE